MIDIHDSSYKRPRPAVLLILDGFGVAPDAKGNAITQAQMPTFQKCVKTYPAMTLRASGEEVGLSWGEMGNSQVGHLSIGAGRVYYQMLPRIDRSIDTGEFLKNEAFLSAMNHVKKNGSTLHLIGLISSGRVHSLNEHCYALLQMAKEQGISNVAIHAFLDGRDTLYNAGIDFISELEEKMQFLGIGKLASFCGRYFAMDRDNRWDRIAKAYEAMVFAKGPQARDAIEAIKTSYAKEIYDEQIVPTILVVDEKPVAIVNNHDAIIFFNFRPDRMREITKAFILPTFDKFERPFLEDLFVVTMGEYEENLPVTIAFPPIKIKNSLAEVFSKEGLKQLHIAETEKYAHVTFFLNGTNEEPFPLEDRVIIPSPGVASYDEVPQMSLFKITDRLLKEIKEETYDFIVANFANPDMVAHTGNLPATIKACEMVDQCLSKIIEAVLRVGGVVFLTADHGNAEEILNIQSQEMDKEHSTNPVPFLIIGKMFEGITAPTGEVPDGDLSLVPPIGMLADVAPTILSILGITKPEEMTGESLL